MPSWRRRSCCSASNASPTARGARLGGVGHAARVAGLALEVEQHHGELDAADAVGDRVVELLDDGRLAVGQALDHGELPQRAGPVEALHADRLGQVEQGAPVARRGRAHPAQVVVEVEVGVDDPAGR